MTEAKDPRDEAERLIASVLGGASVAAENLSGFATGSDECCVCPVCRAIAAARQPNPRVAERIASGAGDLAQGLAGQGAGGTVLADLCLHADLGLLHDAADVVPAVTELVEAHRVGRP